MQDPDCVEAVVTETVRIDVKGTQIEFDAFDFELNKTTFPTVEDKGKADATATISAYVQFAIATDEEKNIIVTDVEAKVRVDALPVTVITANHKWLFNTLLSFFSGTVRQGVQDEVVVRTHAINRCACDAWVSSDRLLVPADPGRGWCAVFGRAAGRGDDADG